MTRRGGSPGGKTTSRVGHAGCWSCRLLRAHDGDQTRPSAGGTRDQRGGAPPRHRSGAVAPLRQPRQSYCRRRQKRVETDILRSMEDFTTFLVIAFPRPWPVASRITLSRQSFDGRIVLLIAHPDGHLEVAAGREGYGIEVRSHFQQIRISGPLHNWTVVVVRWDGRRLRLNLTGGELKVLSEADGRAFAVREQPQLAATRSVDDPNAKAACQKWVDARNARFTKKQAPSSRGPSRPKLLEEQLDELVDAVEALANLVESAKAGKKSLFPPLAAQLRGLIYWPNDRPTWNPLLYRLASINSLALPVYSVPFSPSEKEVIKDADYLIYNLVPAVVRCAPGDVVMDLQEYMVSTLLRVKTAEGERRISIEEALGATANSLGAAHYDDVILLDIDLLKRWAFVETSLLHRVIIGLTETVIVLGRYVVHSYESNSR
jgi:hypothetical protein